MTRPTIRGIATLLAARPRATTMARASSQGALAHRRTSHASMERPPLASVTVSGVEGGSICRVRRWLGVLGKVGRELGAVPVEDHATKRRRLANKLTHHATRNRRAHE